MRNLEKFTREHLLNVCKLGQRAETCSYLVLGVDGMECAKGSATSGLTTEIFLKREQGSMTAMGDNCEGREGSVKNA